MKIILLTSFATLFVVSLTSFFIFYKIIRKKNNKHKDVAFSLCWFSVGLVFFLPMIRTVLFTYECFSLSELLAYILQFLILLIFLSFSYYIFIVSVKNKIIKYLFFTLMILLTTMYSYHLFSDGLIGPFVSDWTAEYAISESTNFYLKLSGFVAVFFLIINIANQLFNRIKNNIKLNLKNLLSPISLLVFAIGGIFEQIIASGWTAFFWRIVILLSVFLAYLSYSFEEEYN
jgi:hypothetical protein